MGGADQSFTARRIGKRVVDILLCVTALPVAVAAAIPIALAVKVGSAGPIFYRARRIGRNGRPFNLLKFRTMTTGSTGPAITRAGDNRITGVGQWLRATKLDELPQIVNVLKGDMSVVGPRPEDPRYVAGYSAEQWIVLSVRPGMTSVAFLYFGDEQAYIERRNPDDVDLFYRREVLPLKLSIEMEYLRSWSLGSDFSVIARTVAGLLSREAA
jgi:lipopolysaccharide/colanic/teichoic acid biosynthesis glycosyltransferase